MTDSTHRPSDLSDVDLVRLLTRDKAGQSADVLAAAEAEALRRGLPIDEAFIPAEDAEEPFISDEGDGELTALNLDWLNEGATALTCGRCGLVQLFAKV